MKNNILRILLGTTTALGLVLTACTDNEAPSAQKEESEKVGALSVEERVTSRALARVEAIMEGRLETAYNFFSPATRNVFSLRSFVARQTQNPAKWKKADVKSVSCDADVCVVALQLSYLYAGSVVGAVGQEFTSEVGEKWVLSDGEWYLVKD